MKQGRDWELAPACDVTHAYTSNFPFTLIRCWYKRVDKLLDYAGRLGIEAKAKFAQTHKEVVEEELATADTTAQPPVCQTLSAVQKTDSVTPVPLHSFEPEGA